MSNFNDFLKKVKTMFQLRIKKLNPGLELSEEQWREIIEDNFEKYLTNYLLFCILQELKKK